MLSSLFPFIQSAHWCVRVSITTGILSDWFSFSCCSKGQMEKHQPLHEVWLGSTAGVSEIKSTGQEVCALISHYKYRVPLSSKEWLQERSNNINGCTVTKRLLWAFAKVLHQSQDKGVFKDFFLAVQWAEVPADLWIRWQLRHWWENMLIFMIISTVHEAPFVPPTPCCVICYVDHSNAQSSRDNVAIPINTKASETESLWSMVITSSTSLSSFKSTPWSGMQVTVSPCQTCVDP